MNEKKVLIPPILIKEEVRDQFRLVCENNNTTMTQVIRDFITRYIRDNAPMEETTIKVAKKRKQKVIPRPRGGKRDEQ